MDRLIGTIRRECVDQTLFWNKRDLEEKLEEYRDYYNAYRVHQALNLKTPEEAYREEPTYPGEIEKFCVAVTWQGSISNPACCLIRNSPFTPSETCPSRRHRQTWAVLPHRGVEELPRLFLPGPELPRQRQGVGQPGRCPDRRRQEPSPRLHRRQAVQAGCHSVNYHFHL